jgi:hypothetical protein
MLAFLRGTQMTAQFADEQFYQRLLAVGTPVGGVML